MREEFVNESKDVKKIYKLAIIQRTLFLLFLSYILFLAKISYNINQIINDEIVKHINNALIELKKILI